MMKSGSDIQPHTPGILAYARPIYLLSSATAIGQLITFATTPILSRLYSPEQFGTLAVFVSMTSILGIVAVLKYEQAIPLPRSDRKSTSILALCIILLPCTSLLLTVLILAFGSSLISKFEVSSLLDVQWLIVAAFMLMGLREVLSAWCTRKEAYRQIAIAKLTGRVTMAVVYITAGLINPSSFWLVVGFCAGEVAWVLTLATVIIGSNGPRMTVARFSSVRPNARRYSRFPKYSLPGSLLNSMGLHMPSLLLASLYSPEVAGIYFMCIRFIGAPPTAIQGGILPVFLKESTRAIHENIPLTPLFRKMAIGIFALSLVFAIMLAALGPWGFGLILGSRWESVGTYAQILSLAVALQLLIPGISQVILILERQDLQLKWEIANITIVCGSIIVPWGMGNSAVTTVAMLSAGITISYLALFGIACWLVRKRDASLDPDTPIN